MSFETKTCKSVEWGSDDFIKKLEMAQEYQRKKEEWEDHRSAVMTIQGN